jgi:hypothetical protein
MWMRTLVITAAVSVGLGVASGHLARAYGDPNESVGSITYHDRGPGLIGGQYACSIHEIKFYRSGWVVHSVKTLTSSAGYNRLSRASTVRSKWLRGDLNEKLSSALQRIQGESRSRQTYSNLSHSSECRHPAEIQLSVGSDPSVSLVGREARNIWSRDVKGALQFLDAR